MSTDTCERRAGTHRHMHMDTHMHINTLLFSAPGTQHKRVLETDAVFEDQPCELEQELSTRAIIVGTRRTCESSELRTSA